MKSGKAPYVPPTLLERVLAAQTGRLAKRDRVMLLLSHYLGLRAKELAGLRLGDVIDPATGQVFDTVRLLGRITKGKRFREVPLTNERVREALRDYLSDRSLRHIDAPLFRSQKGWFFSANTMQRQLARIYQKAGVAASSHSGRRSFATRLIENGADIYAIMELMGHSSIQTTQQYFSTNPERLKRIAGLLP